MFPARLLSLFFLIACSFSQLNAQVHCSKMKSSFSSYEDTYRAIMSTRFEISEQANTYKSSWIRGAKYFSCDGRVGFFLLTTDRKNYIFKDLPYKVWTGFKNAPSHGKYYHDYIENRYYYYLSQ